MKVYVLDIEVFNHDWLVICKNIETQERTVIHNDTTALRAFHEAENLYVTFNGKHYDSYIFKALLCGATPELAKEINDFIIVEQRQGFEHWFLRKTYLSLNVVDVRDDMQQTNSLKSIEGHFYEPIRESSIPFDLPRELTEAEIQETIEYCSWDVDKTEDIFRARKDYFKTKEDLGAEIGLSMIESISSTNAKLTARYLNAVPIETCDEREYVFPEMIDQVKLAPQVAFFEKMWDESIPDEELFKSNLEIELGGMQVKYGFGGVHGGLNHYQEEETETRVLVNYDVASLYPSLMINFGYISRAMRDKDRFVSTYHRRLKAKADGDKKLANALKLVLNTTYGAMLNTWNPLFDPLMGRSVCITGQLLLTDLLLDLLTIAGIKALNFNTDGVLLSVERKNLESVRMVCAAWEKKTGFTLEEEFVKKIVQKDVNNYWMKGADGKVKIKGGWLVHGVTPVGAWSINNSIVAIKQAMVDYFDNGTPVAETILKNQNVFDFQIIAKAGQKYREAYQIVDGEQLPVQKVNRVYATTDTRYGKLIKVKAMDDSEAMIDSLPEHCIIDNNNKITLDSVDKMWYIEVAERRVHEFLLGKIKKTRRTKEIMTKGTALTSLPQETPLRPEVALLRKIFDLQILMGSYTWEKDGLNRAFSYKYITESQYKNNFRKALAQIGLIWTMEETGHEFLGIISDKMHLVLTTFKGSLIDPETGASKEYLFSGSGADNGDKALYKAYTGGLKFYLASNFLVAEDNDPEGELPEVAPKYTAPETRQDVKATLTDPERKANVTQVKAIYRILEKLEKKYPDCKEWIEKLTAKYEGFDTITAAKADAIILAVSAQLEGE